jgi:hypothetical protein
MLPATDSITNGFTCPKAPNPTKRLKKRNWNFMLLRNMIAKLEQLEEVVKRQ